MKKFLRPIVRRVASDQDQRLRHNGKNIPAGAKFALVERLFLYFLTFFDQEPVRFDTDETRQVLVLIVVFRKEDQLTSVRERDDLIGLIVRLDEMFRAKFMKRRNRRPLQGRQGFTDNEPTGPRKDLRKNYQYSHLNESLPAAGRPAVH